MSIYPGLIALLVAQSDKDPVAIYRTFLAVDGSGKTFSAPAKMTPEPCWGRAIRLAEPRDFAMVDAASYGRLSGVHATSVRAWAALATSGRPTRILELPPVTRDVVVLGDGYAPGEDGARWSAHRWLRPRPRVRIAGLPDGLNFSDVLVSGAPDSKAKAA